MTVKDIMNADFPTLYNLPEKELRQVVQQLSSAANKRVANLRKSATGGYSPALKAAEQGSFRTSAGGLFGTRGKNYNQLRNELKRVSGFMGKETSSMKGWKNVNKRVRERLGTDIPQESMGNFWKIYREIEERNKNITGWDSVGVQRSIARQIGQGTSIDNLIANVEREIQQGYEDAAYDEDGFFDIDEDGEDLPF